MIGPNSSRKRKALTKDPPEASEAAVYDELGNGPFKLDAEEDGDLSGSEQSSSLVEFSDEDADPQIDDIGSDEIPSEEQDDSDPEQKIHDSAKHHRNQEENGHMQDTDHLDPEDEVAIRSLKPFRVTTDANGNPRYLYNDIEPVYDSDDSEAPPDNNTIGNIPLSFYDSYPHLGYDINGKRVMRPAKGAALDSLLDTIDLPEGWTGLTDPTTGKPLNLNAEELDVLRKVSQNEAPGEGYDPYPEMIEYFTGRTEQMPLSAAPEPKRRFVPSKHEHRRVMKLVKAIRQGRIQPYHAPADRDEDQDDRERFNYDVWADEAPRPDHPMNIAMPKLPPPGFDESYHPPPEYLPDDSERKEWEEQDEEDKERDYLPTDHSALRRVPGYARFVKDKFERCLDLYLAPRVRRNKLNIDPDSLLPKLPDPDDLRPFPTKQQLVLRGHKGIVRALAVHQSGSHVASGGDDGKIVIWDLENTSEPVWQLHLSSDSPVSALHWRPGNEPVLAAAVGETLYLIVVDVLSVASEAAQQTAMDLLAAGFSSAPQSNGGSGAPKASGTWARPLPRLRAAGVELQITVRAPINSINFHRRGDHLVTISPAGQRSALAIHTLSKHLTQLPLRNLKGLTQHACFHPSKPVLFVATQRSIRSYDLSQQKLLKTLLPGARWISHFDVHPGGDNLVVSSYDKRLAWMDVELSNTAFKTFRYHSKGVRKAKYAPTLPLFADCSDDGSVQVFHGSVTGLEDANIVPLCVLKGHEVKGSLGVIDLEWCPEGEPRLVTSGADGTIRVWGQ